jgi:hypothetical protein
MYPAVNGAIAVDIVYIAGGSTFFAYIVALQNG